MKNSHLFNTIFFSYNKLTNFGKIIWPKFWKKIKFKKKKLKIKNKHSDENK